MKKYIIPTLALISGLMLSIVAAYYSVIGMTRVFVGGGLSIILLFSFLEVSKVVSTIALKRYWDSKIGLLKPILVIFVIFVMLITSMGTFGYLSKASQKQSESVNINSAKVLSLEDNIMRERNKLNNNNTQVEQYNIMLSKLISADIRTASRERKRIQGEIVKLNKEAVVLYANIDKLSVEILPYKTEIKQYEVEVGPLIFITKLIYGDEYKLHLDVMMTYLILIVIFIFDPFAIALLLMSQKAFEIENDDIKKEIPIEFPFVSNNDATADDDMQYNPEQHTYDMMDSVHTTEVPHNVRKNKSYKQSNRQTNISGEK